MREPISFTCKCDRSCKVEKFRTQNLYWGFKSQPNAYHISSRSWISGKKNLSLFPASLHDNNIDLRRKNKYIPRGKS